jgi:phosphate transport system protein
MSLKKNEAIQGILTDFENLSNLVLEQMDILESIMTSGEISVPDDLLEKINANEEDIDRKEVKLSDKIINTIVLYHPMASELRRIMACYRIVISLERIGDLVLNIINFTRKIKSPSIYEKLQEVLHNMTFLSNKMVKKSLLSYLNNDRELAIWTLKNEGVFDESNHKLLKKILSKKDNEEGRKHLLISIINIKEMMSNIERIADHATNIAEAAIYSLEGKDIRHNKIPE